MLLSQQIITKIQTLIHVVYLFVEATIEILELFTVV